MLSLRWLGRVRPIGGMARAARPARPLIPATAVRSPPFRSSRRGRLRHDDRSPRCARGNRLRALSPTVHLATVWILVLSGCHRHSPGGQDCEIEGRVSRGARNHAKDPSVFWPCLRPR